MQAPLDCIRTRAERDGISVTYSEAYPGTSHFPGVPSAMFGESGLNVTYWTNTNYSGAPNQTDKVANITAASYPKELWVSWPQVFSA